MDAKWEKRRKRLFELVEIGSNYDAACWGYDFFNTFTIILNLVVALCIRKYARRQIRL